MNNRKERQTTLFGERRKPLLILHLFSYLILILAFCILGLFSFWCFYPYEPLIINTNPMTVQDKEYHPGDYLIFIMDYEKKTTKSCIMYRKLINDFSIIYSPIISNASPGKRLLKVKLKIPHSAEPGKYRLK